VLKFEFCQIKLG